MIVQTEQAPLAEVSEAIVLTEVTVQTETTPLVSEDIEPTAVIVQT